MSNANTSLSAARKAKNDEFYTRIEDIEREMRHYEKHFEGKTVFLNCDDPSESNFWRYFELNFDRLGLRRLISTHYDPEKPTYMQEIVRGDDLDGDGKHTGLDIRRRDLLGNGDFRSPEAMALLDESDIVVTNPPFSLFREYVSMLAENGKDFIILGNKNAISYKEVWTLFQGGRVWLGATPIGQDMLFHVPPENRDYLVSSKAEGSTWRMVDGTVYARTSACWFTTLDHKRRHEEIPLFRRYEDDPSAYPKYANYDAIEVSKVADIPADYTVEREVTEDELSDITSRGFVVTVLDRPTDRILAPCGSRIRAWECRSRSSGSTTRSSSRSWVSRGRWRRTRRRAGR